MPRKVPKKTKLMTKEEAMMIKMIMVIMMMFMEMRMTIMRMMMMIMMMMMMMDLYIIGAVCVCDEIVTSEKLTHENCTLPTIHLGPAGPRPAWA